MFAPRSPIWTFDCCCCFLNAFAVELTIFLSLCVSNNSESQIFWRSFFYSIFKIFNASPLLFFRWNRKSIRFCSVFSSSFCNLFYESGSVWSGYHRQKTTRCGQIDIWLLEINLSFRISVWLSLERFDVEVPYRHKWHVLKEEWNTPNNLSMCVCVNFSRGDNYFRHTHIFLFITFNYKLKSNFCYLPIVYDHRTVMQHRVANAPKSNKSVELFLLVHLIIHSFWII